jgi:hypothetical protein
MRHPLRGALLALALAAIPACLSIDRPAPSVIETRLSPEQRAYALLSAYAVALEAATDLMRDPAVPAPVKHALAEAERRATPAAEALHASVIAYLRSRDAAAGLALHRTLSEAETSVAHLQALVGSAP